MAEPQGTHEWDVFVSHASEDKEDVVRPLVAKLERLGVKVWYDETSIQIGDRLRESIDNGLARSRYGVVVLSGAYFGKAWPKAELEALIGKETDGETVILPVRHELTAKEIRQRSPILAGRLAASTSEGLDAVATMIGERVLGARDHTGMSEVTPAEDPALRQRDLDSITEVLSSVSTDAFDFFLEKALGAAQLPFSIFDFWEMFRGCIEASRFHIYDAELSEAVFSFYHDWGSCFDFSKWFLPGSGDWYRFAPPVDWRESQAWDKARAKFQETVVRASGSLKALLQVVHTQYPEINIKRTNEIATAEHQQLTEHVTRSLKRKN